jgi:hypothetical protein
MPLHDWKDERGWDGVHLLWLSELVRWLRPRLPDGFRAYVGSVPALTVESSNGRPDLQVRRWQPEPPGPAQETAISLLEPDLEGAATFTFDPHRAIHIDYHGCLVSAIELVSPRNKDRREAKESYASRYLGYLRQGVHLLLVDLLPRPAGFSFLDVLGTALGLAIPATAAPFAASFRVGDPIPKGNAESPLIGVWYRSLHPGHPLPALPLALSSGHRIVIDLEQSYRAACEQAYLDGVEPSASADRGG